MMARNNDTGGIMKALLVAAAAGCVTILTGTQPSGAQAPPGANAAPTDATRLPGDRPPPRGVPQGPPPGAAGGRPPPEVGADAPGPSLALAIEAAQAALAACAADGLKVGVSVIDSTGQPRATLSADGTSGGHVYTGVRKGLTALAFGEPTSQVSEQAKADPAVANRIAPNMAAMAGAVPLMVNGKAIGAVGVSGASSQQDEKCAAAGADKIKARLK